MPCSGLAGDRSVRSAGHGKCLKGARKHFSNTWHFMLVTLNSINSSSNCNFCHATRSTVSAKSMLRFFSVFPLQFNKTVN